MSKKMLVNASHHEENRVAIVEDGILTELDIEVAGHEPSKGNIYRAVVVRVEQGLQAAFVDYGAERLGFLQIDEINYKSVKPDYQPAEDGRRPRINDLLQRGQEILVQITKEERGTKGAALTTYLSLPGRYMVIMPGSQTRGVSRKAESDAQRKELKQAMASIDMTENVGYIVRTAALNQTREELERDYRYLIRLYESIMTLNQKVKAPALLYKESNLIIRSIRDYFTTDMDEVLIDDPQVFNEAKDFFQMVMPDYAKLVKLHQERRPIFSRYQIEDQIEILSRNKVPLPSGGSIVIDTTEALVAVDVNSGKMASEQGVEATATKTNLEAAAEVGRQLRLRDLGGLIVIDFIDMRERKHMREVEKTLKKSLENDKARVSVGRISQFGLLEMSRQRLKATLAEGSYLPCPHCQGAGRLKSPEAQAVSLLRKIHASAAKGQVSKIIAQLPMDVASYLLNNKRDELVDMERDHHLQVHIHGHRDFVADQVEIEIFKKEKEPTARQEFIAATTLKPVEEDTKKDVASTPEPPASDPVAESEPAKKRRRRRRRKTAAAAAAETVQTAGQGDTEIIDTPAEAIEAVTTAEQNKLGQEVPAESGTPAKKPQRRRRSSSKSKPVEAPEAPAEDQAGKEMSAAITTDQTPAGTEETSATKPKPRRGRRKPKPKPAAQANDQATPAPSQPDAQGTTAAPVEPVATGSANSTEGTDKPQAKPRRPRRPAKKAATVTATATETNPAAPPSTTAPAAPPPQESATAIEAPETTASPAAAKPQRRRSSRAKAKPKVETDKPAAAGKENDGVAGEKPAAKTTDKPKRGRPSKKPAPAETPTENE